MTYFKARLAQIVLHPSFLHTTTFTTFTAKFQLPLYKCLRRISRKKRGLGAVCAERQDCSCLKDSPSSTYIQSLSFYLIRTLLLLSLLLFVLFNYPEINTQTVYGYKS